MARVPRVVVFDVNETLSDLRPLGRRFVDVGAPDHLLATWFATVLRDGFALTVVAEKPRFTRLAEGALRTLLTGVTLDREVDAAVEHVMDGFARLPVHSDIPQGVRALRASGLRLVTLTNGSVDITEAILANAGLREQFEALLSVDDAAAWKPARAAYDHALRSCGVAPAEAVLVAVHPWDVDGAARAGMATAWLNRTGAPYPDHFTAPTHTVSALAELVGRL